MEEDDATDVVVVSREQPGSVEVRVPPTPTAPVPNRVPLRPAPTEQPEPTGPQRPFTAVTPVDQVRVGQPVPPEPVVLAEPPAPVEVAPAAVKPANPAFAEITPAKRGALLFEVEVSSGLRARPLQCFERSIAYGSDEWRYDEIESIGYQLYRFRLGLNPLSEVYEFTLRTRTGRIERVRLVAGFLSSRAVKGNTDLLFQAMVSLLHDRVGRSRNLRYLSQLRAGEVVRFGSIRLHRSGVRVGRGPFTRELAWDDIAGAEFVHGAVVVHRSLSDGGTKKCGSVSMSVDNAVLLADLLPLGVERFGRRANRARRHAAA